MAVGLGTVDMPVPSIAEWEWLNWRFPRPVHAGDTVYARWTLTQKRPPVAGAPSSIVVWRVDVHTADGALCAEGEVGAKVKRDSRHGAAKAPEVVATAPAAPPASASRRRRRRPRTNGASLELPAPPVVAAPPAPAAKPERASGPSRRRRRRRSGGSPAQQEEHEPRAAHVPEHAAPDAAPAPPAPAAAAAPAPVRRSGDRGIGRVLKRLRRS